MNDVDPQAWLADVLARLPGHPASRVAELLPWTWKTTQQPNAGMHVRDGRIRNPIGTNMSVRADVLRHAGGFTSDLGRRKLGFSVSGRATFGGKAESCEETEFCIRAARLHPGGYFAYRPGARVIMPCQLSA